MIDACCMQSNVINSGVAGLNLATFLHNVEKSLPFSILKLELWSCNLFWNASVPNEDAVGQFYMFGHKIGCYGNIPWVIIKWINSIHFTIAHKWLIVCPSRQVVNQRYRRANRQTWRCTLKYIQSMIKSSCRSNRWHVHGRRSSQSRLAHQQPFALQHTALGRKKTGHILRNGSAS